MAPGCRPTPFFNVMIISTTSTYGVVNNSTEIAFDDEKINSVLLEWCYGDLSIDGFFRPRKVSVLDVLGLEMCLHPGEVPLVFTVGCLMGAFSAYSRCRVPQERQKQGKQKKKTFEQSLRV